MSTTTIFGLTASILTGASMLPQLIKLIKEKKSGEISLLMLVVLLSGLLAWIIYGILKDDWIIIISNSFSLVINLLMLIFSVKYR